MMLRPRSGVCLVLACALSLAMLGGEPADAATTYSGDFGTSGTGAGQFNTPRGVAIDQATGDVYVVDGALNRVSEFTADGAFVQMWGMQVDETTNGNICTAASGDTCRAGAPSTQAGGFKEPSGIGVDSTTGDIYVEDSGNLRIQKFNPEGHFILTWGKGVDQQTGGNICTAASGHICQQGSPSGQEGHPQAEPPTPTIPTENGGFNNLAQVAGLVVDSQGDVYVADPGAIPDARIQKFEPNGVFVSQLDPQYPAVYTGVFYYPHTMSIDSQGELYVTDNEVVYQFDLSGFGPEGHTPARRIFGKSTNTLQRESVIDPSNQYLITLASDCSTKSTSSGLDIVEYQTTTGQEVDCTNQTALEGGGGLAVSLDHKLYVANPEAHRVDVLETPVAEPPAVASEKASEISARSARIDVRIASNLADTKFHIEYGKSPCSANPCAETEESGSIGDAEYPQPGIQHLSELEPDTVYYFRAVATNSEGTVAGPDRHFRTYAKPEFVPCENNLARQQTGAAFLLDCRAYELVSAGDTGGYNVESDLIPGEEPFAGYPRADGKALYGVHDGGIPGTENPTNRGVDPYVATRDAANHRWDTKYVGVPASAPSATPFSSRPSGADAALGTFAFGGSDGCHPCFADGSTGIPLRLGDGSLVQGMVGSLQVPQPASAGEVNEPLSADGSHFIFGSDQKFEPAGNPDDGNVTIYSRDLKGGSTEVVSTDEAGTALKDGAHVAELAVSGDGSRTLIGDLVREEDGEKYWHLYMHMAGRPGSVDLTPETAGGEPITGVDFAGMTEDGSKVYFATADQMTAGDTDTSADLYRADVGSSSSSLTRVSTGEGTSGNTDNCDPAGNSYNPKDWNVVPGGPTNCSVVAIGGGGGVAARSGSVFFLSPELLGEKAQEDGSEGAPNLYFATPTSTPEYVTTLESGASSPLKAGTHPFTGAFGSFEYPEGVAIDHSDGSIFVYDSTNELFQPTAYVQKFDRSGTPVSAFGSNSKVGGLRSLGAGTAFGMAVGTPTSVAVDNNPASPNYRDVFVLDSAEGVKKLDPSTGAVLQTIPAASPFSSFVTGIAINPINSDIYVGAASLFGTSVNKIEVFDPSGTKLTEFTVTPRPYGIAVDSAGRVYVANGASTSIYSPGGVLETTLDPNASYGVAVEEGTEHVYVDEGAQVREYDSSGQQVGPAFGAGSLSKSVSLASNAGRVVVSNPGAGNVDTFGPAATPPSRAYDSPLVIDSVRSPDTRFAGDFQVTPSGDDAVFFTTLPLTGFDSAEHFEVFRIDTASDSLACVSCNVTEIEPTSDSSLATNGLSITDDGRVFFNSGESLALEDSNSKEDAYEWENGNVALISTGQSDFPAGLLSVSADGQDAFFFTRQTLVAKGDENGTLMKLYDARERGGFFVVPEPPPCAASDECHGPGSQPPAAPAISTVTGEGGNSARPKRKKCRTGFVRRHGRCIRKHERRRHRGHPHG